MSKKYWRKYSVNDNIFDKIDNETSAYLLGFIYADGTVVKKRILRISISPNDSNYLEKLNSCFNSNYPIYIQDRAGTYKGQIATLQINSPRIGKKLTEYGIVVGRNRFYLTRSVIDDTAKRHFIRGYLDGDGCIRGNYNPSVTFVGQPDILEWIRETFYEELMTNPFLKIMHTKGGFNRNGDGIHCINYCGINQSTLICKWLYDNATIWMNRKRDKFENWPAPKNKRKFKYTL